MKKKIQHEFFLHYLQSGVKYFVVLLLFLLMMIPFLIKEYNDSKDRIIDDSVSAMNKVLEICDHQIAYMQRVRDMLLLEQTHGELISLEGNPPTTVYPQLEKLQQKLKLMTINATFVNDVFVLYSKNNVVVSNHYVTDDYRSLYGNFYYEEGMESSQWHDNNFAFDSMVSFLPVQRMYSYYTKPSSYLGLSCVMDCSYMGKITKRSTLTMVFDCHEIIRQMELGSIAEEGMFSIYDASGAPLHLENQDHSSGKFLKISSQSSDFGLRMELKIPYHILRQQIRDSVALMFLLFIGGILIITVLLLFMAYRDTIVFNKIISSASYTINPQTYETNRWNQFTYLTKVLSEHEKELVTLHHNIKSTVFENIISTGMYGRFTQEYVQSLFDSNFSCYTIATAQVVLQNSEDYFPMEDLVHRFSFPLEELLTSPLTIASTSEYEFAILLLHEKNDRQRIVRQIRKFAQTVDNDLEQHFSVNVGISPVSTGVSSIRPSFIMARQALFTHELGENSHVSVFHEAESINPATLDITIPLKLYEAILAGNQDVVQAILEDVQHYFANEKQSVQTKKQYLYSLLLPLHNAEKTLEHHQITVPSLGEYPSHRVDWWKEPLDEFLHSAMALCEVFATEKEKEKDLREQDVVLYIEKHYKEPDLSPLSIAEYLGVSEKYVFTIVRNLTGKTLSKYLEHLRVTEVERLLIEDKLTNKEIAEKSGFGSMSTYYRAFLRKHGTTPVEWREMQDSDQDSNDIL